MSRGLFVFTALQRGKAHTHSVAVLSTLGGLSMFAPAGACWQQSPGPCVRRFSRLQIQECQCRAVRPSQILSFPGLARSFSECLRSRGPHPRTARSDTLPGGRGGTTEGSARGRPADGGSVQGVCRGPGLEGPRVAGARDRKGQCLVAGAGGGDEGRCGRGNVLEEV